MGQGPGARQALPPGRAGVLRDPPPRDYELLTQVLLEAVERDTTGTVRDATGAVAERMGRAAAEASVSGAAGTTDSAEALTNALRLCGYQPSLQDAGDITLRNCPFDRAAKTHREIVCLLNLRLVQGLVDGVGGDAARAALEPAPGHCCVVIHPGLTAGHRAEGLDPVWRSPLGQVSAWFWLTSGLKHAGVVPAGQLPHDDPRGHQQRANARTMGVMAVVTGPYAESLRLPATLAAPGLARRRVVLACDGLDEDARSTAELLTSELVANAVLHPDGGAGREPEIGCTSDAQTSCSGSRCTTTTRPLPFRRTRPQPPGLRHGPASGQRALQRMGARANQQGKAVWFELRLG